MQKESHSRSLKLHNPVTWNPAGLYQVPSAVTEKQTVNLFHHLKIIRTKRFLGFRTLSLTLTYSLSTLSSDMRLQCSSKLCCSRCRCSSESSGKKSFCPRDGILWLLERAAKSSHGLQIISKQNN